MAKSDRRDAVVSIFKGLGAAVGVTIAGMLLLALIVIRTQITDATLTGLNQALKALSVFLGVWAAVGIGGRRGFALGAAVGILYMTLGYALYVPLGGVAPSYKVMTAELAMGG